MQGRGLPEEALAEFDSPETIEGIEAALAANGHRARAHRPRPGAGRAAGRGPPLGPGLQHRRGPLRPLARGAGAGAARGLRPALHLLGPADPGGGPRQGGGQAAGARRRRADGALRGARDRRRRAGLRPGLPGLRQAGRRGHGQGLRAGLQGGRPARRWSRRRAACAPASASRCSPSPSCRAASSRWACSATAPAARVIGVMEIELLANAEAEVYSFVNKELCEDRVVYRLAADAEAQEAGRVALAAYRALGCRDAARLDLRSDGAGPAAVPRGQHAGRAAPDAFRPADPVGQGRHALRGADRRASSQAAAERQGLTAPPGRGGPELGSGVARAGRLVLPAP